VTDNARNMDTMMEQLETKYAANGIEFTATKKRIRCAAHTINLAVQSAIAALSPLPRQQQELENEDEYIINHPTEGASVAVILAKVKKKKKKKNNQQQQQHLIYCTSYTMQ
jgi:hypothetical protein